MASIAQTFPQANEYESYRTWILAFIQDKYKKDLSVVKLALAPNFTLGGGGLYMKSNEGMGNLTLASSATGKTKLELKGNYLIVKAEQMWSMKPAKLRTCWIIWHEFGHALGENLPGREGYGTDEAHAWKFELEAINQAVADGTLIAKWGHSKESIKALLDERVKDAYHPIGAGQIKTFDEEVKPLIEALKLKLA
jgi:hypothetical protein